jgi:hypothetical protein
MSKNQEYAAQYAEYAMEQMRRYGIPASVTLAQGILESSNGQSELSRKGNNHFGIKATTDWLKGGGGYLVYTDDRPNEKFCSYTSVADSYEHHSQFLKNNTRYAECFKLSSDDYKGWTEGLAKAGYASNPHYAAQLQQVIERNGLDKYDKMVASTQSVSASQSVAETKASAQEKASSQDTSSSNLLQQLSGTNQEGLALNQGENSLLEMIVSLFSSLMMLANQLDGQKKDTTQASQKTSNEVDLRSLLPGSKQCLLVQQGENAILHLVQNDVEVHRTLTEVERNRLVQTLQNGNLTDEDKQHRITSLLNGVVISQQLSQNYEQGIEAQQSQRTSRAYSYS